MIPHHYVGGNPISNIDPLGLRVLSECESNEELAYARRSVPTTAPGIGMVMITLNHVAPGILDYRFNEHEFDQFTVDGEIMSAASFGNYIAGYSGFYFAGPIGLNSMHQWGAVFDLEDFASGRPYNFDQDSAADIDAGGMRAALEILGARPIGCGCP